MPSKVTYPKFYFNDEGVKCIQFDHDRHEFKLPYDGYLWIRGELPEQKKKKNKKLKIQKLEFKDKDDIIEYLENYYINSDKNIPGLIYLEKAINYLWTYKDKKDKNKKFGTGDFRKNLDFCSPGTVDSYLDMFVECDIIIKIGKGTFRVNFD